MRGRNRAGRRDGPHSEPRGTGARSRSNIGRRVEACAERMLRRRGCVTLARNWRGDGGEIDRVVLDGETIVFVEVKSRAGGWIDACHPPVGPGQKQRLRRAAHAFRAHYRVEGRPFRFDLITADTAGTRALPHSLRWRRNFMPGTRLQETRDLLGRERGMAVTATGEMR